jgi:phytol kinase
LSSSLLIPAQWLGIALMLGVARLSLVGVCWHRRCFQPRPEVSRKLLHIAMGTSFMALPWMFQETWPVLGLCAAFVGLLLLRRAMPAIDCGVSGVIYGVERSSSGEFWFPVAVAALFLVSRGSPVSFCAPLALLTYADAAAALVGGRYGSIRLRWGGGQKTLEGSGAFFMTALIGTQLSLNLLTSVPSNIAWLVALLVAAIATFIELIAPRGFDNFLVPVISSLLLRLAVITFGS